MDKRNKKLLALSSPDQRWESQTIHGGKKKKNLKKFFSILNLLETQNLQH